MRASHGVRRKNNKLLLSGRHRQCCLLLLLYLLVSVLLRVRDQLLGRHGDGAGALRADCRLGEGDAKVRRFGQLVVVGCLKHDVRIVVNDTKTACTICVLFCQ